MPATGADHLADFVLLCPNLEVLCLSLCYALTDASMVAIGKYCKNLKTLDVSHNRWLTADGVWAVAEGCSSLTEVSCDSCDRLSPTHAVFDNIRERRKNLRVENRSMF